MLLVKMQDLFRISFLNISGVQIAYFAIIATQMSMIFLSIVLLVGIHKVSNEINLFCEVMEKLLTEKAFWIRTILLSFMPVYRKFFRFRSIPFSLSPHSRECTVVQKTENHLIIPWKQQEITIRMMYVMVDVFVDRACVI